MRIVLELTCCVAGGLLVGAACPPLSWAPLLFLAPLAPVLTTRGASAVRGSVLGAAFGLGAIGSLALWVPATVSLWNPELATSAQVLYLGYETLPWLLWGGIQWLARPSAPAWLRVGWPAASAGLVELIFPRVVPYHLGSGFAGWPLLMQPAYLLGVVGLTVLAFLVAGLVVEFSRSQRRCWLLGAGAMLLAWTWGSWLALRLDDAPAWLRVGVVQPAWSVKQWREGDPQELAEALVRWSESLDPAPELVLWPETALDLIRGENGRRPGEGGAREATSSLPDWLPPLLRRVAVPVVFGATAWRDGGFVNRAWVWRDGEVDGYDKRELLLFAERVPARGLLGSVAGRLPTDQQAGKKLGRFEVAGTAVGISICVEGASGSTPRRLREAGARVQLNLSDDAWFTGAAPRLHLALVAMRAAEAGLPTVRCVNLGISAVIDGHGRVLEAFPENVARAATVSVPLAVSGSPPVTQRLFYWLLVVSPIVALAMRRRPGRSPAGTGEGSVA